MEKPYHIGGTESRDGLGRSPAKNGQVPLRMVELIERSKMAVAELLYVLDGRTSKRCCDCRRKAWPRAAFWTKVTF